MQDLLAIHQTRLLALPIMKKGSINAKAATATRRIAKARIRVECIIRKLKCFLFLKGVIPLSCKPYLSSILKVCVALVNLQPCIYDQETGGGGGGFIDGNGSDD